MAEIIEMNKKPNQKYCTNCGQCISSEAHSCPHCGHPQQATPKRHGRDKFIAGLLALFLGSFGIHRFYLGRPVSGILFILFCWTFIPSVIAFIQGIIYFCMSEESFDAKFNRH